MGMQGFDRSLSFLYHKQSVDSLNRQALKNANKVVTAFRNFVSEAETLAANFVAMLQPNYLVAGLA